MRFSDHTIKKRCIRKRRDNQKTMASKYTGRNMTYYLRVRNDIMTSHLLQQERLCHYDEEVYHGVAG